MEVKVNKILIKYYSVPKPARASFWFMICSFMQRGITALTTPIFTRLLTTEQYGAFSTFNSWLEVITVFITLKLAAGVFTQGLVKNEHDREVFTSSLLGLATTSTVIWLIIYLLFHDFFNSLLDLSTSLILAMFGMMWSTIAFNFWSATKRVDYNYRPLVIVTIIVSIAKPLLGIVCVFLTPYYKVEARIFSLAAVEILAYIWLFISMMKKGKMFYNKRYWKYALEFNIPLIPHYSSKNVLNHSDRIMIKMIIGASATGIYSLAYDISSALVIFNTSLNASFAPWMYRKMKNGEIMVMSKITYLLMVVVATINLFLIAVAPEIIALFAPASYSEAIYVIPPVTMAVFFQFLYGFISNFEFYFEKTKWIMTASLLGAVLNIILNACLLPIFGYIAAAYTTLICYIVYSTMHYFFMRKICKRYCDNVQPYSLKMLMMISGVFLFAGFGLMLMFPYRYARYAAIIVALVIAYLKRDFLKDVLDIFIKKKKFNG